MPNDNLIRSQDKVIAGVCGGIAHYLGWNPDKVRLATVIATLLTALLPALIIYFFLWYLMPAPPKQLDEHVQTPISRPA